MKGYLQVLLAAVLLGQSQGLQFQPRVEYVYQFTSTHEAEPIGRLFIQAQVHVAATDNYF